MANSSRPHPQVASADCPHQTTVRGHSSPVLTSPVSTGSINLLNHHHRQHHESNQFGSLKRMNGLHGVKSHSSHPHNGHKRRQSVARLLPEISKLRLLSWLVEASSELISCDIAIMDGVYAKLNRSRESLLFWQQHSRQDKHQPPPRPPPPQPPVQPVSSKRMEISNHQRQFHKQARQKLRQQQRIERITGRDHHSLSVNSYDASSLAEISLGSKLDCSSLVGARSTCSQPTPSLTATTSLPPIDLLAGCDTITTTALIRATGGAIERCEASNQNRCDSNNLSNSDDDDDDDEDNGDDDDDGDDDEADDDDDGNSSAASSSSGIHGTSLSSSSSSTSSSFENAASGTNSAELLSERIKKTVIEHNYLQGLLVNIIRQHDKQRDMQLMEGRSVDAPKLRDQTSCQLPLDQIDLAELADALNDGCHCSCHSQARALNQQQQQQKHQLQFDDSSKPNRASTLPTSSAHISCSLSLFQDHSRMKPARRFKKLRGGGGGTNIGPNREDIIQQLSDKLCESCFETHYWLHGCSSIELTQSASSNQHKSNSYGASKQQQHQDQHLSLSTSPANSMPSSSSAPADDLLADHPATGSSDSQRQLRQQQEDLGAITALRNATFIKLVQQHVRSTLGKSIELIDLIRKEIKSPESIKQKQLMRNFSSSIQLLSSVANYVVPSQDISSFIPEVDQRQARLFSLPERDFDHLLLYPNVASPGPFGGPTSLTSCSFTDSQHQPGNPDDYHLAKAPEIPMRRKFLKQGIEVHESSSSKSLPTPVRSQKVDSFAEKLLSSELKTKLKTMDEQSTPTAASSGTMDSSSGASSNNSSASSSIARGQVQQSSLRRAHTSKVMSTSRIGHELSYAPISQLSRHQQEEELFYQNRPKFWRSSKFNFIKKLLHVKQQRLMRQQSKDRRIYNNKVQNKFRLVMMDLTHFNKSQQLLTTENGLNSLLTSMRNVLEFGLYLTLKLY